MADPLAYLARLQAEAVNGWHKKLRVWVDDYSSVARILRDYAEQETTDDRPRRGEG